MAVVAGPFLPAGPRNGPPPALLIRGSVAIEYLLYRQLRYFLVDDGDFAL